MAISSYSELSAAVQKYVVYDDVSSEITDLLSLAEAVLNREIRIREMKATESYSGQTAQRMTLPTDFSEATVLYESGDDGGVLEYLPEKQFWSSLDARAGSGQPSFYTIDDEEIVLAPTPDAARDYELEYYAEVEGLSVSNPTNAILAKAPDVYLWQVLYQAALLADDAASEAKYLRHYTNAKASLHAADKRARMRPGGRMRSRSTRESAYRIA